MHAKSWGPWAYFKTAQEAMHSFPCYPSKFASATVVLCHASRSLYPFPIVCHATLHITYKDNIELYNNTCLYSGTGDSIYSVSCYEPQDLVLALQYTDGSSYNGHWTIRDKCRSQTAVYS
jgi:hypothetical protein